MSKKLSVVAAILICLSSAPVKANPNYSEVEITAQEIAPGVAVLFGQGGNIGLSYGDDATVLIDDQFAPLSAKIEAAVAQLGARPVRYLVNTHWHRDHTGGNENFAAKGATIIAHDMVRQRLSVDEGETSSSGLKLPVITFDRGLTLHLNDDTMDVLFLGGGHTDGDSIVRWRMANVIHMGDLYFKIPGWPFVDTKSGGDIEHMLFSIDTALTMMDDDTTVIPGHGPLSNKAELLATRNILGEAVTRIRSLKETGDTLEQAQAKRPLDSFDRGEGFIDANEFIASIWESL